MLLPFDDPEPDPARERRHITCALCGRGLVGRQARRRGYGDGCWAKLQERIAPTPPRREVEQDMLPGV